jgi:phage-related baseplate assembly protein
MATTWPQMTAWPNNLHEHAAYFSNYLREALKCIESATDQPVPTPLVKTLISATYALLKKVESTPDNAAVMQALAAIHGDLKTTATTVEITATTVQKSAIATQQAATISQDLPEILSLRPPP